jgi:DNA polymerase-3 subunit epsilon
MAKLFFYDLETTGTRYWKNGIHQISGVIEIDGEIKERFNFKVKPNENCLIEEESLKIANVTIAQISTYTTMKEVFNKLISILSKYVNKFDKKDKFHLVGYNNSSFDNQFLRAFFVQNNDNYFGSWFWSDSIDVMILASNKLMQVGSRSKMIDFKQSSVAKYFGIKVDESKLHDAEYDIDICIQIFKFINKL